MHLVGAISKMHLLICKKGAIFTLCSENKEVLAAGSDGLSVVMETTNGEGGGSVCVCVCVCVCVISTKIHKEFLHYLMPLPSGSWTPLGLPAHKETKTQTMVHFHLQA